MTNKKKLLVLLLGVFILFISLFVFPSINTKARLNFYIIKENIFKPVNLIKYEFIKYINLLNINDNREEYTEKLEHKIKELEFENNNLVLLLSKFNELKEILYQDLTSIPKSVGVRIIGNKNHSIKDNFIIDKGKSSGISVGDYVVSNKSIIGRVKFIDKHSSEVVSILSDDYGDEVIIGFKSYIVSGANKNYINFIRQKDSTEKFQLNIGDKVKIKIGNYYLKLGEVRYMNGKYIVKPELFSKFSYGRVVLNG